MLESILIVVMITISVEAYSLECPTNYSKIETKLGGWLSDDVIRITTCGEGVSNTKNDSLNEAYENAQKDFDRQYTSERFNNKETEKILRMKECVLKDYNWHCVQYFDYTINIDEVKVSHNYVKEYVERRVNPRSFSDINSHFYFGVGERYTLVAGGGYYLGNLYYGLSYDRQVIENDDCLGDTCSDEGDSTLLGVNIGYRIKTKVMDKEVNLLPTLGVGKYSVDSISPDGTPEKENGGKSGMGYKLSIRASVQLKDSLDFFYQHNVYDPKYDWNGQTKGYGSIGISFTW